MSPRDSILSWRQAARTWLRAPQTAITATLTLALGIGVMTAVSSLVDAALLRPLPVPDEDRVVGLIATRSDRGGHYGPAYHTAWEWQERQRSFSAMSIIRQVTVIGPDAEADRWSATRTDLELVAVLGRSPVRGRWFTAEEISGQAPVAVISDRLWRSRSAANPEIVGSRVDIGGLPHTIVGIMPPAPFEAGLGWRDLFLPLDVAETAFQNPDWRPYNVLGRLRDGIALDQARADLVAVAAELERVYPRFNEGWTVELHPIRWWIDDGMRAPLLLLLGGAVLVLLIACSNVVHLLLAHQLGRSRELGVRRALGADSLRLLGQSVRETALLALVATVAGVALAGPAVSWLRSSLADRLPRGELIALDPRVLTLVAVTTLAVTFLCALPGGVTLLRRRLDGSLLARAWQERGTHRFATAAIGTEAALAVVLVALSLLLTRSVFAIASVDPGWNPAGLVTARLELTGASETTPESRRALYQDLLERLRVLPGVEGAALSGVQLPLVDGQGSFELFVEGQPRTETPQIVVTAQYVSPDYFATMGIRTAEGALFTPQSSWDHAHEVVVNRTFAQRYLPAGAVGRWIEWASGDRGTVIGVVEDVRQLGLHLPAAAEVYLAWARAPASQALVLRTGVEPADGIWPVAQAEIEAALPAIRVRDVQTAQELVIGSYASRRLLASVSGAWAVIALLLGGLGVFSLVQHGVRRRRREAAVRMACGARPSQVATLLTRSGLLPAALGAAVGLALAALAARGISAQLYGVAALDAASHLGALGLLLAAAWVAAALPARKAARTDPARELRSD